MRHRFLSGCATAALAVALAAVSARADEADDYRTTTPIKHLVVIFQENVSFDHYFGIYPRAQNKPGETPFNASKRTPKSINTLLTPLDVDDHFKPLVGVDLINNNPNSNPNAPIPPNNMDDGKPIRNAGDATNPFRLSPAQALTQDQNHLERPEQAAYNNGNMDGFPAWVGAAGKPPAGPPAAVGTKGLVMGYFDGNTVTALWNYAQHFSLNDNTYVSQFGPSSPGAINLISGQTNGFAATLNVFTGGPPDITLTDLTHEAFGDASHRPTTLTMIGDSDPLLDKCSNPKLEQVTFAGRNIGDLLNANGVTWGWFQGGFDLTVVNSNGSTGCSRKTLPTAPGTPAFTLDDYIPHHEPFQYYASTRNPSHHRPSSVEAIGYSFIPHSAVPEPANHQYDIHDFYDALNAGRLPAVTFLKAPAFQDGHAGYSDPLDEQHFIIQVVNALQKSPLWHNTAVIIIYDDSDGWYDHQMPPIVNPSFNPDLDKLNGPGVCNKGLQQGRPTPAQPLNGTAGTPVWGRCGYGTRVPFLLVSPFAKRNYVDHTLIDQTSVMRFIEDNWLGGERIQPGGSFDTIAGTIGNMFDFDHRDDELLKVLLHPETGAVVSISGGRAEDHDDH
ncbi:MAG TPA: alkaline phosphatase family protein [Xanthobacteraceae bacterium]|jgi:phospholipase C|nr:alkaline phosphatase family protein [Xanthobacteraceae bacterium]